MVLELYYMVKTDGEYTLVYLKDTRAKELIKLRFNFYLSIVIELEIDNL